MNKAAVLKIAFVFALLPLVPDAARGQKYFKSFNNTVGLADNTVCCICQDARGFIWLGTFNGLCRFDGQQFTTFRNQAGDTASITSNIVRGLQPDGGGLWIATEDGADYYSFGDGRFHHCRFEGRRVKEGTVFRLNHFVKTPKRLFAIDNNGQVYVYRGNYVFAPIRQNGVQYNAITPYTGGLLLAAGPKGIYLLSEDGNTVLGHYALAIPMSVLANLYYSRNSGLVYLGNGIGYQSRAFSIRHNRIYPSGEPVPPSLMATVDYKDKTVFGVDGGGIVMRGKTGETVYTPGSSNISGDAVYSLFVDKDDGLWIGTYRNGLNLYTERFGWFSVISKAGKQLSYDIVTSVVPHGDQLYIGLDGGGLDIYGMKTGERTTLNAGNSGLPDNHVVSMTKDTAYLWMAVYTKGLVRYSLRDGRFATYRMPAVETDDDNAWVVCDDGLGNIWVGGPDVFVFRKSTATARHYSPIGRADCTALMRSGEDIWIACRYKGIYRVDRRTRQVVEHYTETSAGSRLPSNKIRYVYADSRRKLWFTTEFDGFYCLELATGKLKRYDERQGLLDQNVTSISEDGEGNLWMGSYNGLYRYHPRSDGFVKQDVDQAVSEYTFGGSSFDGQRMYFSTTKGLVSFAPRQISIPPLCTEVAFLSLSLISSDHTVFDLFTDKDQRIKLAYNQNFFTVKYAVPELISPHRMHFSCKMKGLEREWRELGAAREVSYTNIPPGSYELHVRCIDENGRWAKPSVLYITVTPPWYLALWAKLLWGALALMAVYASVRVYLHNLNIRHRIELAEVEKASEHRLNDAKMNFYTSITHELRTPVFLIAAQLEGLLNERKSILQVPITYIDAIHRNALRLNDLISRVIDFRKIGAENLSLKLERSDVVAFCQNLTEAYTEMFRQKHITYELVSSAPQIMLDFDTLKLEMIISNLISNAFKYTEEGGRVLLTLAEDAGRVIFAVSDNGIGIDEKVRDTIFESFFRSPRGRRQSSGDGLGLSYVKQLVALHGGDISVESEMGKYSVFTFYIPKRDVTEEDAGDVAVARPQNPTATHTLLVIDDKQESVDVIARYLENDFKVLKAYDGEEGLKLAAGCLPDLIITDIMMPGMGGIELLRELKGDKRLQHIPVIIFTACTSEDEMLETLDYGVDAYLTKPASLRLLRKRIDKLLEQPRQQDIVALESSAKQAPAQSYTKEEQRFLLRCREIIDSNIKNEEFSIDSLADALAMSHSALYKKIKQMTGMSLIEFINDYKIYKAVQLFEQGATNIETVSEACGFNDVKNFRLMFKRKTGLTPKQYVMRL